MLSGLQWSRLESHLSEILPAMDWPRSRVRVRRALSPVRRRNPPYPPASYLQQPELRAFGRWEFAGSRRNDLMASCRLLPLFISFRRSTRKERASSRSFSGCRRGRPRRPRRFTAGFAFAGLPGLAIRCTRPSRADRHRPDGCTARSCAAMRARAIYRICRRLAPVRASAEARLCLRSCRRTSGRPIPDLTRSQHLWHRS